MKTYEDKIKELSQELSVKEEHNLSLRSDLLSSQEKLKSKSDEVRIFHFFLLKCLTALLSIIEILIFKASRLEIEAQNLEQKCHFLAEETKKLEQSLDKSRDNGERLHKESEMVIANVNSWVHEQRNNSEKLAIKIREQAAAIIQLTGEKEKLLHENETLQQQIRKISLDLENASFDKEKIKVCYLK